MGNTATDWFFMGTCLWITWRLRADIVEEIKNWIRKASPGGGYILSSSNTWVGGAKLENCLAMVETVRKIW